MMRAALVLALVGCSNTGAPSLANHASYFVALYSSPCEKVDGFSCHVTLTGPTRIVAEGGQE